MADRPLSARAEHDAAQGSGFPDALAAGRLPLDAYADLAVQHWFVYETLKVAGQEMAKDPVAGRFVLPELDRAPANRPRSWPRCPRRTG